MATTVIPVIYGNGQTVHDGAADGRPGAVVFEVLEGAYAGRRGSDTALYELVGPILVDWSTVSMYETGSHIGCNLCARARQAEARHGEPAALRVTSVAKCLDEAVGF